VPIRPNIGTVPRGWELVEVRRDPSTVTLAGEGDALARITAIDTARVDISDLRGSNAYSVPLEVPSGVTVLGPSSARVTVTLRRIESRSSSAEQAPEQGAPGGGVSERQPGEADGDKPPADQEEAGGLQKSDGGKNPRRSTEPSGPADADRADTRRTPADAN
jgi:YbbR domain-containing protein